MIKRQSLTKAGLKKHASSCVLSATERCDKEGDGMERLIYALKIGLVTFLVYCAARYFHPTFDHFYETMVFSLVVVILTVCLSLFLIGKPNS